ncbi:hypothetical protein P7C73_g4993, partial [Tremellales sp. Uapishka_1]
MVSLTRPSHPDLIYPDLPDAEADIPLGRARAASLDDFEWPEAGPSGSGGEAKLGPLGSKAVAAITGAITTSLLMTPFDVLKTRLQTHQPNLKSRPPIPVPSTASSMECCQASILTPQTSNPLTCLSSASAGQIEAEPIPSSRVGFSSLRPSEPPTGCLQPTRWQGIWGEAITIDQAVARGIVRNPSWSAGVEQATVGGFWNEVATVRRETGVRGLWKGVGTTLTMSIPSAAIYMLGYEYLLSQISPYFTGSSDPTLNQSSLNRSSSQSSTASLTPAPLIAGSMARTLSASVISPIEMFRTRLQALPSAVHGTPTYASTAKDMLKMVHTSGVTVLYRGLGPTLWRDVPFSGEQTFILAQLSSLSAQCDMTIVHGTIERYLLDPFSSCFLPFLFSSSLLLLRSPAFFTSPLLLLPPLVFLPLASTPFLLSFPAAKHHSSTSGLYWAGFELLKSNLTSTSPSLSPLATSFISGAVSGTFAALLTQPFDVLKTRRQVFTPSPGCSPKAPTIPLALHVIKTEGWGALFAGTVPRCGKIAPACGLMIACYEGVGRYLGGR